MTQILTAAGALLRRYWIPAVILAAAACLFAGGYRAGTAAGQAEVAQLKLQYAENAAAAEAEYAQALVKAQKAAAAWQQQAAETDRALAEADKERRARAAETKKGISDALAKDKAALHCIDGFGPNGLQQYKRALGY